MGTHSHLTVGEREGIITDLVKGLNVKTICDKWKVVPSTVTMIKKKYTYTKIFRKDDEQLKFTL